MTEPLEGWVTGRHMVVVNRTSDVFGHIREVPVNTVVELIRFDPADNSWRCRVVEGGEGGWFYTASLQPLETEDDLDREALELFGVTEKPAHCETCTCHKRRRP